jgi:hypothetical protein
MLAGWHHDVKRKGTTTEEENKIDPPPGVGSWNVRTIFSVQGIGAASRNAT